MDEQATKHALDRNGYAVARGLFDSAAVGAVLSDCRDVLRVQVERHGIRISGQEGHDLDDALPALFGTSMASFLAAAKLTQYLTSLHRLGLDERIMALLRSLGVDRPVISTRPVVHIVADALKVPGGYHRTPPHQDWRSVQGSLDALVVWLPLVPTGPDASPLEVAPGSHRLGLLPTVPHAFGTTVAPGQIAEDVFVPIAAQPGDAVVFSMFLVHRTGRSVGPGVRWAVSYRYNNLDEPSFAARDFPNPYIYRPKDELLTEGFPTADDIRRVFGDG